MAILFMKYIARILAPMKTKETRGRKLKYPFASMRVGAYITATITSSGILNAAKQWAERNNKERLFSVRVIDGETRLYRIK